MDIETFEKLLNKTLDEKLDGRFEKLEGRFEKLEEKIDKLSGYIAIESATIEKELQSVIKSYLKNAYPQMTPRIFNMKRISNPKTPTDVTDLDAAFLLYPLRKNINLSRLKNKGIPRIEPLKYEPSNLIFVFGEAKHNITYDKVNKKLGQYIEIKNIFTSAQKILETGDVSGYTRKFIKMVHNNKYLANVTECRVIFGANYWEKDLLEQLQIAINKYKYINNEFVNNVIEIKILEEKKENTNISIRSIKNKQTKLTQLYNHIYNLERNWLYKQEEYMKKLSNEEIIKLSSIDSIFNYINCVYPSGQRYMIDNASNLLNI